MEDSGVDSQDSDSKVLRQQVDRLSTSLEKPERSVSLAAPVHGYANRLFSADSDSSDSETELASFKTKILRKTKLTGDDESSAVRYANTSTVTIQPTTKQKSQNKGYQDSGTNQEQNSLLVDVPMSESEEDIPLSWQANRGRAMRDQLLRDGFNLDLESDNEDLDLIPPRKQNTILGGVCSCSNDSCVIS